MCGSGRQSEILWMNNIRKPDKGQLEPGYISAVMGNKNCLTAIPAKIVLVITLRNDLGEEILEQTVGHLF